MTKRTTARGTIATGNAQARRALTGFHIVGASVMTLAMSTPALAEVPQMPPAQLAQAAVELRTFDIPAGDLQAALLTFSQQGDLQLIYPAPLTAGLMTQGVQGTYTPRAALARLLAGTNLIYDVTPQGTVTISKANDGASAAMLGPITVEADAGTPSQGQIGNLPEAYAGGQVARGGRVGLLGNQDVFDIPFSMTSYTSELMDNQQAKTLSDVVQNDSSAYMINAERSPTHTIAIRGFNTGGNSGPLYDGLQGMSHRRYASVENLERVEIFKGANSLLTGAAGRVGGTVNLVPKRPLDDPLTELTASYEMDAQGGGEVDVSRRYGNEKQIGVRFNGSYQDGESTPENYTDRLGEASLALDLRLDRFRADVIVDYSGRDMDSPNQLFSGVVAVPSAPDVSEAIQQPWEFTENDFVRGLMRLEYDVTRNWTAYGALGATDFDGLFLRTTGASLAANGDFTQTAREQRDFEKNVTGAIGVRGEAVTGPVSHKISVEAQRNDSESGRDRQNIAGYSITSNVFNPVFTSQPGYTPLSGDVPTTFKGTSDSVAFADVIGLYDERVLLTLGVRHQRVRSENIDATTGATTSLYDESALTPAVGVTFKATEKLSIYGNYVESLEQGSTAPSTAANAGQVFAPAMTKQVEFGVKYDAGTMGFSAGVFRLEQPSGITDASNVYSIDGEQENRGLELSAFGEIRPGLRLLSGLTFMDAKLTRTENGTNDGKSAIGVPKLAAVVGVEWDAPMVEGLTFSARANHMGSQYIDTANTKEISSYQLFSLGARYEKNIGGHDLIFRANVSNLLDEDYWITFPGSSNLLYYGAPRVVSLSATMRF